MYGPEGPGRQAIVQNPAGLVGYIARRTISPILWAKIRWDGLEGDFRQEFHAAALEIRGMPLKDAGRLVQRRLYRALKNYGYRREGSGYIRSEIPLSEEV